MALRYSLGKFLFNLFLPNTSNQTKEVDVVLIHPKVFFVVKSKNYAEWIFGNEVKRALTQILPQGRGKEGQAKFNSFIFGLVTKAISRGSSDHLKI